MPNNIEQPRFEHYANFDFEKENPDFPLKLGIYAKKDDAAEKSENAKENNTDENFDTSFGGFVNTVEIDSDNVAKFTRALSVDREHFGERPELLKSRQHPDTLESLADHVSVPDELVEERKANVKASVEKLLSVSGIRRDTYETVRAYMGDHVAELKLTTIVDSPRRVIEESNNRNKIEEIKQKSMDNYDEIIRKIPTSEITFMEIWENVGMRNSLDNKSIKELKELYKNPEYLAQQKDFAEKAYRLLMDRGLMLDLCDRRGGIRVMVDEKSRLRNVRNVEGTLDVIKNSSDQLDPPVYRNLAYKKGRVIYYDIYPTWYIPTRGISESYLEDISDAIEIGDKEKILELIGVKSDEDLANNDLVSEEEKSRRFVFQYLALLKSMGLDSYDVSDYDLESYEATYEQKARLSLLTDILSECEKKEIKLSVVGGYGLDGLYGKLTRPHEDLDLVVEDFYVEDFDKILQKKGFVIENNGNEKNVYINPQYPKFKIEFALLSQALEITEGLRTEDFMSKEPNASFNGVPFNAPNINAVKEIIRVQNERASVGNWGSYRIDKRRNMEALMKYLDEKV